MLPLLDAGPRLVSSLVFVCSVGLSGRLGVVGSSIFSLFRLLFVSTPFLF